VSELEREEPDETGAPSRRSGSSQLNTGSSSNAAASAELSVLIWRGEASSGAGWLLMERF
jgi:hypothetical protein